MLKVENRLKEEIAEIDRKIGEAFAAEKAGIVTMLTEEQAVKAFEIMTDYFYRAGVLYATSEAGEGYLAYWEKKKKPALGPALHMVSVLYVSCRLRQAWLLRRAAANSTQRFLRKSRIISLYPW